MQAMKLFMGAVAMASALEVDTESGPNKIQVAAQPGNAGVVSKTIKLATAAGVSAMAVEAINKLGTFETSPSGNDGPCEKRDSSGKCILCFADKGFVTPDGKCVEKCEANTFPVWCPYKRCLSSADLTTLTGTTGCANALPNSPVPSWASQCMNFGTNTAVDVTQATCVYCAYGTIGGAANNGIEDIVCDLTQAEKYDDDRVAAEFKSLPVYKAENDCANGPGQSCVSAFTGTGRGWNKLDEQVGRALKSYAEAGPKYKFNDLTIRGAPNADFTKKGAEVILCELIYDSAVTNNRVQFNGDTDITTLAYCSKEQAMKLTNANTFTARGPSRLAKLPAWWCEVPHPPLFTIDFRGSDVCRNQVLQANAVNTELQGALVSPCNNQNDARCCFWDAANGQDIINVCNFKTADATKQQVWKDLFEETPK